MAMSQSHKDKLAEGRRQSAAIKRYLSALASRKPGRPVTKDSLEARLERLKSKIETEADPLRRVELTQQRLDVEDALANIGIPEDDAALEAEFVVAVKAYSDRKGISYSAWRSVGVPAGVLRKAGVARTRRG